MVSAFLNGLNERVRAALVIAFPRNGFSCIGLGLDCAFVRMWAGSSSVSSSEEVSVSSGWYSSESSETSVSLYTTFARFALVIGMAVVECTGCLKE